MSTSILPPPVEAPLGVHIKAFLDQHRIAVVGVTRTREDAANLNYRKLKDRGYEVIPINPYAEMFDGDTCYPDLSSIPEKPEAVFIVTSPNVAQKVVREALDLGIYHIWMHCSLGTHPPGFLKKAADKISSVSEEAVKLAENKGINVIPGGCPMMFVDPPDNGHRLMRAMLRLIGAFKE